MATETKLPTPATSGDIYLAAAVEELRRLNRNIEKLVGAAQAAVDTDEVELKEPAKATTRDAKPAADKAKKR